jgi:hypothetical protein
MRVRVLISVLALAALSCAILPGCSARGGQGSARPAASAPSPPSTGSHHVAGRLGSAGNPLLLSCGQESFSVPPVPQRPQPGDLVIGPLMIVGGKRLATGNPAGYGQDGTYKVPIIVTMGSTVTMTIAAPVRGRVVIDNPNSRVGGVASATYHSCARTPGFFPQSIAFTRGQVRGCVPLDVRIDHQQGLRHVTLSLFAGSCAAAASYARRP